ncbi:mCG140730 [Mus musculus]|nr:mCG140730 [Mus musculus]
MGPDVYGSHVVGGQSHLLHAVLTPSIGLCAYYTPVVCAPVYTHCPDMCLGHC